MTPVTPIPQAQHPTVPADTVARALAAEFGTPAAVRTFLAERTTRHATVPAATAELPGCSLWAACFAAA